MTVNAEVLTADDRRENEIRITMSDLGAVPSDAIDEIWLVNAIQFLLLRLDELRTKASG